MMLPQIRLRTIFLIFFCVSVGLAASSNPINALQPAIATAMAIGLIQQVRELRNLQAQDQSTASDISFAIRFAVAWRIAMAFLIIVCVSPQLFDARNVLKLPMLKEFHTPLFVPSIYHVLQLCIIVVLSSSVWQKQLHIAKPPTSLLRFIIPWAAGAAWLVAMVPDFGIIHFLVHIATQGIEAAHPLRFQRAGAFPNHQQEGFRLFWLTLLSITSLFLAGVTLTWIRVNRTLGRRMNVAGLLTFGALISTAAIFCVWYYGWEFHRVSPDMASAGFGVTWLEWLCAFGLAGIVITAAAYRTSATSTIVRLTSERLGRDVAEPPIHDSLPVLMLLIAESSCMSFMWIKVIFVSPSVTTREIVECALRTPDLYLTFAIVMLSFRLCWLRWRRRNDPPAWQIRPLNRRALLSNSIAVAMFVFMGVPILSAFCFVYWLGPWYLYGP